MANIDRFGEKLNEMSFEELLALMKPRINFHVNKALTKLPGYERDDLFQEFSIEFWVKLCKVPDDIKCYDWRFLRYFDVIFSRRVIDLWRKLTYKNKKSDDELYRDELNRCLPMVDDFDEWWSNRL